MARHSPDPDREAPVAAASVQSRAAPARIICRPHSSCAHRSLELLVARHTAALDSLVGRTLGRRRYEVLARIAQGGMAIVYRGHDRQLDRVVAIKVPRPELARDRAFSEQFRREARAAARLSHPNVVAVYDSGEERGLPWIVMEHVSGQTLRGLLDAKGRLDPETTAELLGPVADALDHAHHAGIAHLDVKPENVLLASEAVKVADFGLVRAAAQRGHGQALAATVHYCAPEVLRGGVVDGRADVYALGVVAWECLVGRPPFEGDQAMIIQQHLRGRVPPPSGRLQGVPEAFDAAVLRATDPDPVRRYLRASDFAAAIGAPRRRRVDEALRATTVVAAPAHDTAVVDAQPGQMHRGAPAGTGGAWAPTRPGAVAHPGAPRGDPPAGWAPLGPRPTTGRTPKTRAARAKSRSRGRWLAVLLVLGLLATGLITRAGGLLGGSVRVPAVVGEAVGEATRSLQSRGLRVQVAKPVPSERVHEGLVATQSVAGGEAVKRETTVVLEPSLGILVPNLTGRSAGSAGSTLEDLRIRFRQERATSLTVRKGNVIRTRPAAGSVLKDGQSIVMVVSVGKPKVEVPQVAGRRFDDARAVLAAAHLQAKRTVTFDDLPKGLVVRTEPAAGAGATWGSTVTVVVSKGPDLVVVPDVVGLSKGQAEQRLREAGLRWSYVLPIGSQVVDQSPEPGDKAKRGSDVRLLLNLL
jgi:beta-lactam-binding protein with PASTA domain/tRNA A-37 threonylcarbamoyl transferase component Bud32